jgi:hypothetical protein
VDSCRRRVWFVQSISITIFVQNQKDFYSRMHWRAPILGPGFKQPFRLFGAMRGICKAKAKERSETALSFADPLA